MDLLKDGVAMGAVEQAGNSIKLTLDGLTKSYPVYRIRLDLLFYNEQNDRIATWISQYKSEHNGMTPDVSMGEDYNKIIEKYVIDSSGATFERTKKNIYDYKQLRPGVVLSDGRVIDGNRRFTCLRSLAEKYPEYNYFEAVILERDIKNSAKQIKLLELSVQHGEEEKVDYSPVDRLVGVYNDIIDTRLLTIDEYARATNESIKIVKSRVEQAELMVEFLEFINAPKQFHIIRELEIGYIFEEILPIKKKCSTEDEWEDIKNVIFTNLVMKKDGDLRPYIRSVKKIAGSDFSETYISEQLDVAEKVVETLENVKNITKDDIINIRKEQKELGNNLERTTELMVAKINAKNARNEPLVYIDKALEFINNIDLDVLNMMNRDKLAKRKFIKKLNDLEDAFNLLKECLDE